MAGHVRYTALLDACVLFPVLTCDALMSVAADGMFAAKWTREIDREWTSNLETYKGAPAGAFDARRDCMHDACPDWEVEEAAWRAILPCVRLPDANDHHVLAAAIAGHADCIVTTNLADFPTRLLHPSGSRLSTLMTFCARSSISPPFACLRRSRPCARDAEIRS